MIPGDPGYLLSFLGGPLLDNNRTGGAWQGEGHGASLGEEMEEEEEEDDDEGEQGRTGTRTEEDKVPQRQS